MSIEFNFQVREGTKCYGESRKRNLACSGILQNQKAEETMASTPTSLVALSFSCRGLANMDLRSKSGE
jgi:hypothetical protein